VAHQWASLDQAVGWIHAAGGVAVVAHPARYRLSDAELQRMFAAFVVCGGVGIEVVSGSQNHDSIERCARWARRYQLLASRGSDFHGPGESFIDLGAPPPLPAQLTPVWSRWALG
jgi:predicted metal-dependent phosphoesterase TrpH